MYSLPDNRGKHTKLKIINSIGNKVHSKTINGNAINVGLFH